MNLVEALKGGTRVRRPIAKHTGSNNTGWLDSQYVIILLTARSGWSYPSHYSENLIDEVDLLASDWEAKNE